MSTRSAIGIKHNDGTITGVYCHFDGYLDHVGKILKEHYDTKIKVEELLSFGDMSSLYENVHPNPNEVHDFENRQENVCVFYHRDRGESWKDTQPLSFHDEQDFIDYYEWSSYYYLFDDDVWYWRTKRSEWKEL